MSRRKASPLVQAITAYNNLDEKDRATLAEYVRSQTPRASKGKTKTKKTDAPTDQAKGATV